MSAVDFTRLDSTFFCFDRMKSVRATVAGAGALGNEVVRLLGLLGAGVITVVDPDLVHPTNLTRSVFFRYSDSIGRNKAKALVEAATPLFPNTRFEAIGTEIADIGFGRIASSDLIFSCVDTDLARVEIAYIAQKLGIPVADAGLGGADLVRGRVSFFPPGGACFCCLLSARRRREIFSLWDAAGRSCAFGESHESTGLATTCVTASIIASAQVHYGLRHALRCDNEVCKASTWLIALEPAPRFDRYAISVGEGCPLHGNIEALFPAAETARGVMAGAGIAGVSCLLLDWPMCLRAHCIACGHEWEPLERLARLRRTGRCPLCGGGDPDEIVVLRSIGPDSEWYDRPLTAAGLPEQHLYTVRRASAG